jgi:heme exporter protein CcmD
MDWSADHAGFVVACYALSFIFIVGLTLQVLVRDRRSRAALALFEKTRKQ